MKITGWELYVGMTNYQLHYVKFIEHRMFHCYIYFSGRDEDKYITRYRIYVRLNKGDWYTHFDFPINPNPLVTHKNIKHILDTSLKDLIILQL